MYFLQAGCIEVYIHSEGREFLLERLFRGSVINHNTFFQTHYAGEVYLRFTETSILKELTLQRMNELCEANKSLLKAFQYYKLKYFGIQQPLDYIMRLPRHIMVSLVFEEIENYQSDCNDKDLSPNISSSDIFVQGTKQYTCL